ncbi:ABC transporter permease [Lysinibacillus pakistanensis]|uniref:ABC transporter permease n=1 Tax=Lysinibacillus pakistanensis TaxID=759811 RepID=UPI003D2DF366
MKNGLIYFKKVNKPYPDTASSWNHRIYYYENDSSDPASVMLGPQASVEDVENLREELGLNKSIPSQFISYVADLAQLNLGYSYSYSESVIGLIIERFPNTVILALAALLIAVVIGIPAGILAARKQNTIIDYVVMLISLVGVSMPIFWLGIMLVLFFSVNLGWLPATGMGNLDDGLGHISNITVASICTSYYTDGDICSYNTFEYAGSYFTGLY